MDGASKLNRVTRRLVLALALSTPACSSWCNRAPKKDSDKDKKDQPRVELLSEGREPKAELEVGRWSGFRYWLTLETDTSLGIQGMAPVKAPTSSVTFAFEVTRGGADPIVREQDGEERKLIEERSVVEDVRVRSAELPPAAVLQIQTALGGLRGTATRQLVGVNGEIVELKTELVGGHKPTPEIKQVLDQALDMHRRFPFRLPPTPVGVGARWRFTDPMKINGVRATQVAEMTLTSLGDKSARIAIRVRLEAGTQMIAHPMNPLRQATLEGFRGDGDGELEIDRMTAVLLSGRLATTAKLQLSSTDSNGKREAGTFMAASVLRIQGGAGAPPPPPKETGADAGAAADAARSVEAGP